MAYSLSNFSSIAYFFMIKCKKSNKKETKKNFSDIILSEIWIEYCLKKMNGKE
jgi:hypothetical protein